MFPLKQLPRELRDKIYEFMLVRDTIAIVRIKDETLSTDGRDPKRCTIFCTRKIPDVQQNLVIQEAFPQHFFRGSCHLLRSMADILFDEYVQI